MTSTGLRVLAEGKAQKPRTPEAYIVESLGYSMHTFVWTPLHHNCSKLSHLILVVPRSRHLHARITCLSIMQCRLSQHPACLLLHAAPLSHAITCCQKSKIMRSCTCLQGHLHWVPKVRSFQVRGLLLTCSNRTQSRVPSMALTMPSIYCITDRISKAGCHEASGMPLKLQEPC
jgi:hypothetical protein